MKFDDKIPIYYQIKQYIYKEIIINHLTPGSKVPAVRQLALDLAVNVNTVQRSLRELISEGVLESQRGKGNFVTTNPEILNNLRKNIVEEQLSLMYDHLASLQLTPDEMIQALTEYVNKRKEMHHG
ncbi:GntR family transcriptional regulator [Pediococcus pentosaceus]|uniref:GntR family transcriptional regulator n=1 Tax=Pediococcus pentosaceus TaxID=1255 RepID=UPI0022E54A24|nr:GntR family transcriptional regulator [Pediococcus pentosaceus]MDB1561297.1 GntR family transcriptional regulator [Pediococcus pentosaceus]